MFAYSCQTTTGRRHLLLFCLALALGFLSPLTVRAGDPAPQILPDGLALKIDGLRVELGVVNSHIFRLGLGAPASDSHRSVFLAAAPTTSPKFTVTSQAPMMGVKTDSGELVVDTRKRAWALRNARGELVTDWSPLGTTAGTSPATVGPVTVEASPASHPQYYGSGNCPQLGSLTQTEAKSLAGNGSTSLPQYWSTAGYGAWLITENDNHPATWKTNTTGGVTWSVEGARADLYLTPAANLYDWLRADAELTGFAPLPPLWSFGYMQSRWGWKDKAYLDDTLARFRKDRLPVDVFIVDFEWYTKTPDYEVKAPGDPNYIDFDWNPKLFPNPAHQIAEFAKEGVHVVGIRKPRIGNAEALVMARQKGWILPVNPLDPNNDNIRTRNLDYSNPGVQSWWIENNRKFLEAGMAGFWNDEGETNYTEYAYWNLTENDLFHQVVPNTRFWSLNRSFSPGLQRLGAAAWTGDIDADWPTLAKTTGELLSYSLSGMPYNTCDVGGYAGNPSPELLTRWIEAGVFFPILRTHSSIVSTPHFPWLAGPEAEAAIRKALDLRYQLIPYYYSLAYENFRTGAPLMRPLVMEFPTDPQCAGRTDEWLMGSGLLAAPVLQEGGNRSTYLPGGEWYAFGSGTKLPGAQTIASKSKLDEIPIYVRAGTILPLGPVQQSTSLPSEAPLEVQIYPGKNGSFTLREDDGTTFDYQLGKTRSTAFSWDDQSGLLNWKVSGDYSGPRFEKIKAVLFTADGPVSQEASLSQDGSIHFH